METIKKTFRDYIREFHKEIKKEFPQYSQKQILDVCYSSFKRLAGSISKGDFTPVRFKYLGLFRVKMWRAKKMLGVLERAREKDNIEEKVYLEQTKILENYVEKFKRNKDVQ